MVRNNTSESRFESGAGDDLAVASYRTGEGAITFTHTKVPAHLEGQGVGGELAKAGLDFARQEGLRVVPECPFIAHYIEEHPEYRDLL